MSEDQAMLMLCLFAGALWFTWKQAYTKGSYEGYQSGYDEAVYDVAHGNITVTLKPPRE